MVVPVAMRWILRRPSNRSFCRARFTPEQILIGAGATLVSAFFIGIYRMGGDVMGAVFPLDGRSGLRCGGVVQWKVGRADF